MLYNVIHVYIRCNDLLHVVFKALSIFGLGTTCSDLQLSVEITYDNFPWLPYDLYILVQ